MTAGEGDPGLGWRVGGSEARGSPTSRWWPVAAVVAMLTAHNVVVHRTPSEVTDLGVIVLTSGGLVLLGRTAGLSLTDLGVARGQLRRSVGTSIRAGGSVLIALVCTAVIPVTRGFLADDRFVGVGVPEATRRALLDIPFNVTFEEFAFRGVLLAVLLGLLPSRAALVTSSGLFGLWHVLPTLEQVATTWPGMPPLGAAGAVVGIVCVTAVAGAVFAWLRLRFDSLLLPVAVHGALNLGAHVLGWAIVRW